MLGFLEVICKLGDFVLIVDDDDLVGVSKFLLKVLVSIVIFFNRGLV